VPTEIPAHLGEQLDLRVKGTAEPTKKDNLVYDVGMHEGEDTAYYLKKGFHVVAFEANPELIARNKRRFAPEMVSGRLVIVEGAIVPDYWWSSVRASGEAPTRRRLSGRLPTREVRPTRV
jgi:hypothetical protein